MPNWCANRIQIVAPMCLTAEIEAWANGTMFPYHTRAIQQSIRLFIAGVAGRLKPAESTHYAPYPALTGHGCGGDTVASCAFGEWLALLQANVYLDEETCGAIDRCYQTCGMTGLTWDSLTRGEQAAVDDVMRVHDVRSVSHAALFDGLEAEPDGEVFDLRLIKPTRLACEINGFNGRLLEGVSRAYDFYIDNYGTKWPANCDADITVENGWLCIDVDTAWAPPSESVLEALSQRWNCTVRHYYSEAGCDFCGYRLYENGMMMDCIDGSLDYDDEDEDGYSYVIGPEWLVGNVPHYGG